jgi:poly(3-hydroxybutyrate) depolymerase
MIMYPKLSLENAVNVELYKMTSVGHEWPEIERGSNISAPKIVWNFLSKYSLNGLVVTASEQ